MHPPVKGRTQQTVQSMVSHTRQQSISASPVKPTQRSNQHLESLTAMVLQHGTESPDRMGGPQTKKHIFMRSIEIFQRNVHWIPRSRILIEGKMGCVAIHHIRFFNRPSPKKEI